MMMKLMDREWKAFYISDERENGIFKLRSSLSGIDKNKLMNSAFSDIPYITRSDFDNGIAMFVSKEQKPKYKIDKGNVITIGLDTQTVFYQPHSFYTGQNIQVLYNQYINKYNAKFIIPLLKMQVSKLSWGGNGATLGRLKRMQLLLPISDDGTPDYLFMEEFIKERELIKRKEYFDYCNNQLKNFGGGYKIVPLVDKKWAPFFIINIFDEIQRGKRLKKADHLMGNIPYVSSSSLNNGIDNFISNNKNIRKFSNCLSLANSGSVGTVFFEPFTFVASDHVTSLKKFNTSPYVYLFLATMIEKQKINFNFNREINDLRIRKMRIMLPIDADYNPDYLYMEYYEKNIIAIMLEKYREFITTQIIIK